MNTGRLYSITMMAALGLAVATGCKSQRALDVTHIPEKETVDGKKPGNSNPGGTSGGNTAGGGLGNGNTGSAMVIPWSLLITTIHSILTQNRRTIETET